MKIGLTKSLFAACLLATALSASAASIKCWQNNEGVMECGSFVPPEYSQKRVEIRNERGIVVKVNDRAKTEAEKAEYARKMALKKEEDRRLAEERQYDQVLAMTYPTEHDLELSHQDNVGAINGIIEIAQTNSRSLHSKLREVQSRAANHERAGGQTPKFLLSEMDQLKKQIAHNEKYIASKKQEIATKDKKYQSDLKRFRRLKGIKAPTAKP